MNYSRPAACVIGPSAIDMVGCAEADRRAVANGIEVHSRPSTSMLSTDSESISFAWYSWQKETRKSNSPRWLASPGDFELRKSFRSCAARPIEWYSITS